MIIDLEKVVGYVSRNIRDILDGLVLTKTQRQRAVVLYTHVCEYLNEQGMDINFYPQGSFAEKTTVRPYRNGENQAYDVDVICELVSNVEDITPSELKSRFKDILMDSRYSEKITEYDTCFTIEFKKEAGVNFLIDIIPCIPEKDEKKAELYSVTERPELMASAIAIPRISEGNRYSWITNNPKGYIEWFENEIKNFYQNYLTESLSFETRASIEELPEEDFNNALLNIIKLLKRARDVFYSRRNSDNKPSSIIITTIVAKLALKLKPTIDELDLLKQIIIQLKYLEKYSSEGKSLKEEVSGYGISSIITRDGGKWILNNPANGGDNLLNSWNEDKNKAKEFFEWVDNLDRVLFSLIKDADDKSINELYNSFATEMPQEVTRNTLFTTKEIAKPWRRK